MSALEEIDLQLLHTGSSEEPGVASHTEGQKSLEQPGKGVMNDVFTSRWKKIYLCVLTLLGYTSAYAARGTVTAFYAIVAQNHNVETYISGFVIGAPELCMALLSPFIGYFLPHFGLKFTQVAGLFLAGGSEVLFGFVSKMATPTLFITFSLLLKVVEGIGLAMFATASVTLLIKLYLQRKGLLAGLIQLAVSIGFFIGVPVGGGLQEVGGFVLPLIVFGGFNLIVTVLLLVNVHPTEGTRAKLPLCIVFKILNNVLLVLVVLCAVLSIGTYFSLMSFFGHFLNTYFGIRVGIIGAIYLSGLLLSTLASLCAGLLADLKLKIAHYLLIGGLVVGFAGCVLIGPATFISTPKLWLSILAWVVFQPGIVFACVPVYPAMFEAVKKLHVEEAVITSTLSGILNTSFSTGAFLGPVIGGALVYQVGFPWMTAMSGLILLIYALVMTIATVFPRILRKMNAKKGLH